MKIFMIEANLVLRRCRSGGWNLHVPFVLRNLLDLVMAEHYSLADGAEHVGLVIRLFAVLLTIESGKLLAQTYP